MKKIKLAIFHNLDKGGAAYFLSEFTKSLKLRRHHVDIYSLKNENKNTTQLGGTNNVYSHLLQILYEIPRLSKSISNSISANNYDVIIVFPCQLTQAPTILRYLDPNKTIYLLTEPKREFYEKTSFDHNTIKRLSARILRLPIKFIDIYNTRKTKNIITISYYEQSLIKKIYKKKSVVIHPALTTTNLTKINLKNKNIITIGQLSYLKGHHTTLKQLQPNQKITLLGRATNETDEIKKLATKQNIDLEIIQTENDSTKTRILKKHNIFAANYIKEPYGIATLEAIDAGLFVVGTNDGGTPEIVQHGVNGLLYPNNIKIAKKTMEKVFSSNNLIYFKNKRIDWNATTNNILRMADYLTNND